MPATCTAPGDDHDVVAATAGPVGRVDDDDVDDDVLVVALVPNTGMMTAADADILCCKLAGL